MKNDRMSTTVIASTITAVPVYHYLFLILNATFIASCCMFIRDVKKYGRDVMKCGLNPSVIFSVRGICFKKGKEKWLNKLVDYESHLYNYNPSIPRYLVFLFGTELKKGCV